MTNSFLLIVPIHSHYPLPRTQQRVPRREQVHTRSTHGYKPGCRRILVRTCIDQHGNTILRRQHHYPTTMDHSLLMSILHPRLSTVCLHLCKLCHVWNMFETCCAQGHGSRSGNEIYNRSFFNRNYPLNLVSSEHSLKHFKDLNTLQYS